MMDSNDNDSIFQSNSDNNTMEIFFNLLCNNQKATWQLQQLKKVKKFF